MRDKRFIAEHRGGSLRKEQHRQLIIWACECAENVLPLLGEEVDTRLTDALLTARAWSEGNTPTGNAMKASRGVHALAREYADIVAVAVARAVGHAVATAHMADHSLGSALYALKALKTAGKSIDNEREWQDHLLPEEIKEMVLSSRKQKEKSFRLNI